MPGYAIELLVLAHADGRTVLDAFRSALGAIAHPDARFDMVRCGIGIYGLDPSPSLRGRVPFEPAMSLRVNSPR